MSERQGMSSDVCRDSAADPKRQRVLDSALAVVLRYGFQRMTMDDIAKAAGISRPALYLLFKNKAEIYRSIACNMLREALTEAETALSQAGTLEQRLLCAMEAGVLKPMELLLASAHGAELLDMKHNMAGDVMREWRTKKSALLAQIIDAHGSKSVPLTGQQRADILLDAVEGLKQRTLDLKEIRDGIRVTVKLIAS